MKFPARSHEHQKTSSSPESSISTDASRPPPLLQVAWAESSTDACPEQVPMSLPGITMCILCFAWGNCSLTTFPMLLPPGSLSWFSLGLYTPSGVREAAVQGWMLFTFFLQCCCSLLSHCRELNKPSSRDAESPSICWSQSPVFIK